MSSDEINAAVDAAAEIEACPVTVLGRDLRSAILFYVGRSGDFRAFRPTDLNRPNIVDLFAGNTDWLLQAFPRRDGKIGIAFTEVFQWLTREAHLAGPFDPGRQLRGPGVWRGASDEDIIVHCGDRVWIDGAWREAGFRHGHFVYPALAPEERPADEPASADEGRELVGFLEAWNWQSPALAPQLFAGFMACAMICGALDWRPHVLVSGGKGTGKSSLNRCFEAVLGRTSILKTSDPSAAGVRQALLSAARPVMLDEVEHEAGSYRADDLVKLARLGSTEGQGAVLRGSREGSAAAWDIRACFYFSSILPPPLKAQDASRMAVLALGPLASEPEAIRAVKEGLRYFAGRGPALRARLIQGFERFLINLEVYRYALAEAGADNRQCDQFGSLLAAHDVLTDDAPTSTEAAERAARALMPSQLVPDRAQEDEVQCLNHLLTYHAEMLWGGGRQFMSIGYLAALVQRDATAERRLQLANWGVAFRDEGAAGRWLVVAHQHQSLERIFRGTRWERGVWKASLERLPGATVGPSVRFAGYQGRGVWLPADDDPKGRWAGVVTPIDEFIEDAQPPPDTEPPPEGA